MGKYDALDKEYFGEAARFAELISAGIYHKKIRVMPEELQMLSGKYSSIAGDNGELARDCLCLCERHRIKYGLEIENYADFGMPRRIFTYDACEYTSDHKAYRQRHDKAGDWNSFEEKKSGITKTDKYYGVINAVLYLGMGHYKGHMTMRDCMKKVPGEVLPYAHDKIQNYGFVLIEADYVNPEDYQTDLRQFFKVLQARNDKRRCMEMLQSSEFQSLSIQTQKVIAVHMNHKGFIKKVVEENEDMCKALRDLEKDWKQEGIEQGIEQGIERGIEQGIERGIEQGIERGIEQGIQENLLENLRLLMQKLRFTVEQAMDTLEVAPDKREEYRRILLGR